MQPAASPTDPHAAMTDDRDTPHRKPANMRTALVLLTIAAAFFAGVIINHLYFR
jgi:hypothetical protein